MSPKECLIKGIVFLVVAILEFAVVIFRPHYLKQARWGRFDGGPPMSRIGGASWGVAFCAFGIVAILNGYFSVLSGLGVGLILLVGSIQLFAAGFYDWLRHQR